MLFTNFIERYQYATTQVEYQNRNLPGVWKCIGFKAEQKRVINSCHVKASSAVKNNRIQVDKDEIRKHNDYSDVECKQVGLQECWWSVYSWSVPAMTQLLKR